MIDCCNEYLEHLSTEWRKYQNSHAQPNIELRVQTTDIIPDVDQILKVGWNCIQTNKGKLTIYSDKDDGALFGIEYGHIAHSATVYLYTHSMKILSLGLQYAMMITLSDYCIGLHGVTAICGDQVIILSAPSGTGKTTLAGLLRKYKEAAVINGDFALLSVGDDGNIYFEPTPFCGSSKICHNYRLRINRIVFLNQSKTNEYSLLNERHGLVQLMSNAFVPTWDKRLVNLIQEAAIRIIERIPVDSYSFVPTQEAAEVFYSKVIH